MNEGWPLASDRPAILTVALPGAAGVGDTVFGGWIMAQFDHAAGRAGKALAGGPCLIRAVRELVFHAGLRIGTDFAVYAREVKRGRTSLTLALEGLADPDGARLRIASAEIVLVAVDAGGRPRALIA